MPRLDPRKLLPATLAALHLSAVPLPALAEEGEEVAEEVVAEALFLADTIPAGSRDFNLVLAVERDDAGDLGTFPALQYAAPLGGRFGFTVDVSIPRGGGALEDPALSFKYLLREASREATGLSACADVFGSLDRGVDPEVALGLGALRPVGRVALRATALAATGVSGWAPRLHAGASAAVQLSPRLRALAEVTADVTRGEAVFSAGPTLKVALGERFSAMAGALFELGRTALPVFTLQLTSTM